jgi:hypothetical protein
MARSIYGRSSIKDIYFDLIRPQTWLPHAILFSEGSIPKKSASLQSLGQMYRNLVGSIYGRFSIKIAHFGSIRLQTWPS